MKRYKAGVIGLGYIGNAHIEGLMRLGIEVLAVADVNENSCKTVAGRFGIRKTYSEYKELIDDQDIESVHICTPNNMHYEISRYAAEKGKHIVCEKPLALNSEESRELVRIAKENNVFTAVNFNYRYYPVVHHAREMAAKGELGGLNIIQGYYLQDWLFYDTDYNWRLEPEVGGMSRAIADIGSHWCDLAQFVSGLKITEVMADLKTVYPIRKKPKNQAATFSKSDCSEYEEKPMFTEDYGAVIVRFENDARGVFSVSQVSAGRKCKILLEIYGSEKSIVWDHEKANELWIGHRDKPNEILTKDPALLNLSGKRFAHYPGGHPEGYPSAPMNLFMDFYTFIAEKESGQEAIAGFPTFTDGHNQVVLTEAILKSSKEKRWVAVL